MAGASSSNGPITAINVTPLVDIALVLLIIFIVTAKLVVTPAVPVDLPQARKSEEVQTILSIIISGNGEVLANGAPVSNDTTLGALAREHLQRDPQLRVVIAADGAVAHRRVIGVLDTLRVAGVVRVAFGVTPENNDPPSREKGQPDPAHRSGERPWRRQQHRRLWQHGGSLPENGKQP